MYKGYKIIKGNRFYQIRDGTNKVCAVGTISNLEQKGTKKVINDFLLQRIPKTPHKKIETEIKNNELVVDVICTCGECGCNLGKKSNLYKLCRCPNCSQEIDWSKI